MAGQHEVQQVLLWVIHLERVSVLVLSAIGAAALALRLLILRRRGKRPDGGETWITSARGLAIAAVSLGAALIAGFFAISPDAFFLTQMGRDAVARKDAVDIIAYYEPLVRSRPVGLDVYENLALAYITQRRPQEGIAVLHQALALTPALEDHLICASVHLALGEVAQARQHAEAARPLAGTPEQQAAVDRLVAATQAPTPGPRP